VPGESYVRLRRGGNLAQRCTTEFYDEWNNAMSHFYFDSFLQ